ncbi:hypothetical protein G6321_00035925 [Bradyrhizobium barranii subsp. barranii]|nr:hypothetical protein [Bradyrhizobium barranii]UGX91158.1 hypothetical protein G6321_00035925 [Bradyrhizobium barranii subsp. barranii]
MWSQPTFRLERNLHETAPINPLHRGQTDRATSPRKFLLSGRGLLVNRRYMLAKHYGDVRKTRDALVTAGEITQPTKRGIVQSEQAFVATAADFDDGCILQLLQVGQRKSWAHDPGPSLFSLRAVCDQLTCQRLRDIYFPTNRLPFHRSKLLLPFASTTSRTA